MKKTFKYQIPALVIIMIFAGLMSVQAQKKATAQGQQEIKATQEELKTMQAELKEMQEKIMEYQKVIVHNSIPVSEKLDLSNPVDRASYALGMNLFENLKGQGVDSINIGAMARGMVDVMHGYGTEISDEEAQVLVQQFLSESLRRAAEKKKMLGVKFLEENKKKEGIITTESGLQYEIITAGDGAKPTEKDKVTTHYHGTTIDGNVFDSSVDRGEPVQFPVNGVISGWTEALQLMPVGSKWRLYIPSELAYGERGAGAAIGPNEVLIFEVELISIDK